MWQERIDIETATLGGGCFWCLEAVFEQLKGVNLVVSGYCGGNFKQPTYDQVCEGVTGHAEVVQLTFDPAVLSFREVLEAFFAIHDPTTVDRQDNDVGSQYRSVIFYHSPEQADIANGLIAELEKQSIWDAPIVHKCYRQNRSMRRKPIIRNISETIRRKAIVSILLPPKLPNSVGTLLPY